MSALRRLERGGYAFALTPAGKITFRYTWPDEPPLFLPCTPAPLPLCTNYLPLPGTMLHSN